VCECVRIKSSLASAAAHACRIFVSRITISLLRHSKFISLRAGDRKIVEVRILSSAPFDSASALAEASLMAGQVTACRVEWCPERAQRVEGRSTNNPLPVDRGRWHRRPNALVYIVRCADASLYVGHTDNVLRREARHNDPRRRLASRASERGRRRALRTAPQSGSQGDVLRRLVEWGEPTFCWR
jgi:predicted GIY-YIG superfamily endonuclease